jgi:hypothetical protein
VITADYVTDVRDGPVLRIAGDPVSVGLLRDAFDVLAAGGVPDFGFLQGASLGIDLAAHGGVRQLGEDHFVLCGDTEQWDTWARLLDPLTGEGEGWQYLDYHGQCAGDITIIVTTCADGRW